MTTLNGYDMILLTSGLWTTQQKNISSENILAYYDNQKKTIVGSNSSPTLVQLSSKSTEFLNGIQISSDLVISEASILGLAHQMGCRSKIYEEIHNGVNYIK